MSGTANRARPGSSRFVVLRVGALAWFVTALLLISWGATPHARAESRLLQFGALQREWVPALISHRGAALTAPENTLAAIHQAVALGADAVELDVQLTADHVPVLLHDSTLQRTTSGSGRVRERTVDYVTALDAGSWFHPEFAAERVPTLAAAIDAAESAPLTLFLELKDDWSEAQLRPVLDELRAHSLLNRVVLQSFNLLTLESLRSAAPEFARVMLTRHLGSETVSRALLLGVSGVGARAPLFAAFPEAAADLRRAGLATAVYTLNDAAQWQFAVDFGFDLVISDDPAGYAAWVAQHATLRHTPAQL